MRCAVCCVLCAVCCACCVSLSQKSSSHSVVVVVVTVVVVVLVVSYRITHRKISPPPPGIMDFKADFLRNKDKNIPGTQLRWCRRKYLVDPDFPLTHRSAFCALSLSPSTASKVMRGGVCYLAVCFIRYTAVSIYIYTRYMIRVPITIIICCDIRTSIQPPYDVPGTR